MNARRGRWSRPADGWSVALATAGAVALFTVSWALLHVGFWERTQIRDTPVYQRYGDATARGEVPYRDFRPEYPPAALPAFVLPSLAVGAEAAAERYDRAFEWLMLACGIAAVALVGLSLALLRASPVRAGLSLAFVGLAPLALGTVVLSRFDLWPAALAAGALAAVLAGRERIGAVVLALAVAAKLYPAVLVPLAAAVVWRRHGRRAALVAGAVFLGVLASVVLPFLLLAPEGFAGSLWRQLGRPLQIEALGAAVLVALGHAGAVDVEMRASAGSQNIGGAPGVVVGLVHSVVQAAVLVGLAVRFARGPAVPERLVRYAAASVLAFVVLGKVLSPQFLVWLVPLVPLVAGRRGLLAGGLLAAALVLTQLWFPFRYWDYAREFDGTVTALVLVRDLVLVALLVVLVWPSRTRPDAGHGSAARAA